MILSRGLVALELEKIVLLGSKQIPTMMEVSEEIGVPPVIIHLFVIFHEINHPAILGGSPILEEALYKLVSYICRTHFIFQAVTIGCTSPEKSVLLP